MNKILLLVTVSFLVNIVTAQTGTNTTWTFVKGDTAIPLLPSYGTKGVPSAFNQPGGRTNFVTCKDKNGNFWLFGGYRNQDALNDLWKYDPTTNTWTWVSGDNVPGIYGVYGTKGVASPSNKPAGRFLAVGWMDNTDNLWVFGGEGNNYNYGGSFNDLWKYNISTNEWTWMSGDSLTREVQGNYGRFGVEAAGNKPGARSRALGWSDISGDLWLFGGIGYANNADASGDLNDLWKYNTSTNAWTWVKGDSIIHGKAVYGTKEVAGRDISRTAGASAQRGQTIAETIGFLVGSVRAILFLFRALSNDLWKYNPRTNEWTWVNGDSSYNFEGIYGLQGVSSPGNQPGARHSSISWKDNSGNFWLFGGAENENSIYVNYNKNDLWKYSPLLNEWTWMKGDTSKNAFGVYGTRGSEAPQNRPGARTGGGWADASDRFWLFGGEGNAAKGHSNLNDLWQFNTSTNDWSWQSGDSSTIVTGEYRTQGVEDNANKPGPRAGGVSWTDNEGKLWLFGGGGTTENLSGSLNDLWRLDPLTNNWTWVKGDSIPDAAASYGTIGVATVANKPGGRGGSASWTDASGKLWIFGGSGLEGAALNDLWSYNVSSGNWTWEKGSNDNSTDPGVYGMQGVPAPDNNPGGRWSSCAWTDKAGNFWLFGGSFNIPCVRCPTFSYDDLWKFDITTRNWTWVKGSNTTNQRGIYGQQEVPDANNNPASRHGASSWVDANGNFWLFGGYAGPAYQGEGKVGYYNDLWRYDIESNQWTWMKGDNTPGAAGVYGIKGTPSPTNKPEARLGSFTWVDASGDLWLFGGSSNRGELNDLWKYQVASNRWVWVKGDSTAGTLGIYDINNPNSRPGARVGGVSWKDNGNNFWLFGGSGYASNGRSALNDLWKISSISLLPLTLLKFYAKPMENNVRVNWQTANELNTSHFIIERSQDGSHFSTIGKTAAARNSSTTKDYSFLDLRPFNGTNLYRLKMVDADNQFTYSRVVSVKLNTSTSLQVYPNPAGEVLFVQTTGINETVKLQITDASGRRLKTQKVVISGGAPLRINIKDLPKGNYSLHLTKKDETKTIKFVKM